MSVLKVSWEALGPSWDGLGSVLESSCDFFVAPKAYGKRFGSDSLKIFKTIKFIVRYCKNRGSEVLKSTKIMIFQLENSQNTSKIN